MSVLAYDKDTNRVAKAKDLEIVNALLRAKRKKGPWDVVRMIVNIFKVKHPQRYKSYIVRLEKVRDSQKVTSVGNSLFRGVSKDKENDAYMAHTVDFPAWIMGLLRKVYNTNELQMDKKFFREFGKRFPEFRVMEKV